MCLGLCTESDVNICLVKAWNTIDRLLIIWESDLFDKIQVFFHAVVVSILLYGSTSWTPTKHIDKKLDQNYPRMLLLPLTNPVLAN